MIKKVILGVLLNGAALYGVTYLMPTQVLYSGGITFFALGGLVMGLLNSVVKPILKLLTLPLAVLTLGFSLVLLNGVIFWIFDIIIKALVIDGVTLTVTSIKAYFLAGFIFGILNWIEHLLVRP